MHPVFVMVQLQYSFREYSGYTYEWYDASYNTIGQSGSTANNLCQGTYNCIVESNIGCLDTIQVTIAEDCGQFGHFASAPMIQNCVNNEFYNTTWSTSSTKSTLQAFYTTEMTLGHFC